MKPATRFSVVAGLAFLILAGSASAQQLSTDAARMCSPVGMWLGRNETFGLEFIVTIRPLGVGLYTIESEGCEAPLPYEVQTSWRGVIYRSGPSTFSLAQIVLGAPSRLSDPADEVPDIGGIRGELTMVDCGRFEVVFDPVGIYAWGQVPFVDDPLTTCSASFGTYVRVPIPGAHRRPVD